MRIKFTQNYRVKDATGKEYNVGDVLNCSVSTANHFLNRGVAVIAPVEKPKPVAEAPVERRPVGRPAKKAAAKRALGGHPRTGE